jgi:MFS-type transporter involved in bile tolerance (Atg22 family)
MQICIAICGVWCLVFVLGFTAPWLHARPGPSLPEYASRFGLLSYFLFSWKKTYQTVRRSTKLKATFLYLISWFLYADGYSTIGGVAILFGKSTLNMNNLQLMIIAVTTPLIAVVGNYFFLFVFHKKLGMSSRNIVILLLFLMLLIPVYGILGFFVPDHIAIGIQ